MPITYERDDERRRIVVTTIGIVGIDDLLTVIDRQASEETWQYGVLYDSRRVASVASQTDVRTRQKRSRASQGVWVRKNVVVDQRKLDAVRRVLAVETETEAIDVALDLVAFRRELARGVAAIRPAGGIEDVFEKRHV
jgi:alpha-D-ribose 1-methylphosphonate 5-phosphate C-P lyase